MRQVNDATNGLKRYFMPEGGWWLLRVVEENKRAALFSEGHVFEVWMVVARAILAQGSHHQHLI